MPELELTIGLCAYQEADNLRILLPQVMCAAQALTPFFEVLVVDTQVETDDTEAVCRQNNVRHVRRSGGNHYADAVRTMIHEARGCHLLHMDADGSHQASDLATLWNARQRYDIVIGSRYIPGASSKNPPLLQWQSRCLNLVMRACTGFDLHDFSNSLRVYPTKLLRPMELCCRNFEVLEEMLILLHEQNPGLRIGEVPTSFEKRAYGQSKRELFRFLLSYMSLRKIVRR